MQDAFTLAYGGLHWGFDEIRRLTWRQRDTFIALLEAQWAAERRARGTGGR